MKKILALLLVLTLVITSTVGCGTDFFGPFDFGSDDEDDEQGTGLFGSVGSDDKDVEPPFSFVGDVEESNVNKDMTLGDMSLGFRLFVEEGTFDKDVKVEVRTTTPEEVNAAKNDAKYEIVGTPVHVTADSYKGGPFGTDVKLTLPMPENCEGGLGQVVVLYFPDEGEVQYMTPDSYDSEAGTITVNLPHLSLFGTGKLTKEEQVNMYLDKYAAGEAIRRLDQTQAASDLEPYIQAKIKDLKLSKEAGRELTLSVINAIGGKFGDDPGMYTDLATATYKSIDDSDPSSFEDKVEEIISGKLYDMINYNVFTGQADSKFKDAGKLGTIVGAIAGGDKETALREIGDAIGSAVPAIGLTTKAIGYVGAKVNESFTNWKSNQIEDLYQKFKNGYEDIWGNEVVAGDEESLKTYIYTGSGLSRAKGVYRFYNMDKAAETCEKYGWGHKEYEELDDHYREIFDQRAEEGLMNYFRTRLAQENEIEKIKESERECVDQMLTSYGCLSSGNFNKFFGEQSDDDYNLAERLERIGRVKSTLLQYVDEAALAKSQKDGIYNWGVLMNDWVSLVTVNKHDEAVLQFIAKLKSYGVLNKEFDTGLAIDDLVGTYSGKVTTVAVRVTDDMYHMYMNEGLKEEYAQMGVDINISSKADCDAALAEYVDQINLGQEITIEKTGSNTCTVSGLLVSEETIPMSAPAVYEDGKLTLTTEEGTTQITVKEKDGIITLKSSGAVFLMYYEEEGIQESFLIEAKINVKK